MADNINSSIEELLQVIEDMGPGARQRALLERLDNDPNFNQYAENVARQEQPFFRYTNQPELYRHMKPYEEMCQRLLLATLKNEKTFQSYKWLKKLRLRTSFGGLPFCLVSVYTQSLYRGYLVVSVPTVMKLKKRAQSRGQFYSDDIAALAMAHECGHADQHLRNRTPKYPIQAEMLADEFGAMLVHNAGYSLYKAIRTLPALASELGGEAHPPMSERCLHLVDYGLRNGLFNKEELSEVHKFRADLEKRIQEKAHLTDDIFAHKNDENAVARLILQNEHIFRRDDLSEILTLLSEDTNKHFLSAPQLVNVSVPVRKEQKNAQPLQKVTKNKKPHPLCRTR